MQGKLAAVFALAGLFGFWLSGPLRAATPTAAPHVAVPCGGDQPSYPGASERASIRVHFSDELGAQWSPAACAGWAPANVSFLIVTAARFRHEGGVEEIAGRLGAISRYREMPYWSHTRKVWRPLMLEAFALANTDVNSKRPDFAPAEMLDGQPHYFWQSASGKFAYRVQVREHSATRMVVEMENITGFAMLLLPAFRPGDARMLYFIEHEAGDVWRYYALISIAGPFTSFVRTGEESFINRAGAIFRYLAGIPAKQEPPYAPG